jgi:hypothetical protein
MVSSCGHGDIKFESHKNYWLHEGLSASQSLFSVVLSIDGPENEPADLSMAQFEVEGSDMHWDMKLASLLHRPVCDFTLLNLQKKKKNIKQHDMRLTLHLTV